MRTVIAYIITMLTFQSLNAQTEFSLDNATHLVKVLSVEIGPRPMGSAAEHRALQFAVEKFKEYGCDSTFIMKMEYSTRANTTSGIAVGIKRGATKRIILLGGHIDSAGPEVPGADDDGSGAATVMELARVLGKREMQSTIVFCCWGGEEQGLEGSKYFANHFDQLDSVALMLQVDMANGLGIIELDPDVHGKSAPAWLVRAAMEEFHNLGYEHMGYPTHWFSINYAMSQGAGSDHESFLEKGIPAIDFSTDINKPIHTPRDNFENFDPHGLKRSGDLLLKLTERFDTGTPNRTTERYWLYLLGSTPIIIPFGGVWVFVGIAIVLAIAGFFSVRSRREPPDATNRIRWSGIKMIPLTMVIVACGWLSSDIIAVLKGIRFPWFANIEWYYLLAFVAMLIGTSIVVKVAGKLTLSRCPYIYYKRSVIMLLIFLICLGLISTKLMVEPAVALFLISLAILIRNPFLKLVFIILSPIWMIRLVFSEWVGLLLRAFTEATPAGGGAVIVNGLYVIVFSIYLLPFSYAIAAVVKDSTPLYTVVRILKSRSVIIGSCAVFAVLCAYLVTIPSYDHLWYRNVRMIENVDLSKHTIDINLVSSEYLSGVRLKHAQVDTIFTDRSTTARITPHTPPDTTWLTVQRMESRKASGDTTHFEVKLALRTTIRPYTVSATYSSGKKEPLNFSTPWKYRTLTTNNIIDWYSFPESPITVPLKFDVVGKDSVEEKIEVTFDTLAYPMVGERELTYFIPRTRYVDGWVYKR